MDLHYKQEVTVGALVLAGIGLFVAGTFWLQGNRLGGGGNEMRVAFADVGTLKKGSAVRVSGVKLGTVSAITFEAVGKVVVTLDLDEVIKPKIDATAKLTTVGLVADAVVVLHPGSSSEPLPADRVVQGTIDQGLMELGTELGDQAKQALAGINEIANKELAGNLNATLTAMQRFMATYSDTRRGPAAEMVATMDQLQSLSAQLESTLTKADLPSTLRRSDTLVSNLSGTTAEFTTTAARLDSLFQRLNRGDGTLGKLVNDSLLYGDLRRLVNSFQELADDLRKHPGKITIQVKTF
ncbi:MAG: MCE family protein [Gemmatimonadetes bacterium]|nr:MCE family protein [Gemmatimonadota bacterium]